MYKQKEGLIHDKTLDNVLEDPRRMDTLRWKRMGRLRGFVLETRAHVGLQC